MISKIGKTDGQAGPLDKDKPSTWIDWPKAEVSNVSSEYPNSPAEQARLQTFWAKYKPNQERDS